MGDVLPARGELMLRNHLVTNALVSACTLLAGCASTGVTGYAYSQSTVPILSEGKSVNPEAKLNAAVTDNHWVENLDWSLSPARFYEGAQERREKLVQVRSQLGGFKQAVQQAKPWEQDSPVASARAFHAVLVDHVMTFSACYFGDISRGDLVWDEAEPAAGATGTELAPEPASKEAAVTRSPTGLTVRVDSDGDYVVSSETKQQVLFAWSIRSQGARPRLASGARLAAHALESADPEGLEVLRVAAERCVEEYAQVDGLVGLLDEYLKRQQRRFVTLHVLNALDEPIIVLPVAKGEGDSNFQRIDIHEGFAATLNVPLPIAPKQYAEISFQALDASGATAKLRLEYLAPVSKGLEHRAVWLETPEPEQRDIVEQ